MYLAAYEGGRKYLKNTECYFYLNYTIKKKPLNEEIKRNEEEKEKKIDKKNRRGAGIMIWNVDE